MGTIYPLEVGCVQKQAKFTNLYLIIQCFLCLLEPGQSSSIPRKPVRVEGLVGAIGHIHHQLTAHWMGSEDVHYQRKGAAETRQKVF